MKQLDLSENNLTKLFDCKPFHIENISLSNNQLENVDLLSKFTTLYIINLNNNKISYLNSDILHSNYNLVSFDFSRNQIKNGTFIYDLNKRLERIFIDKESMKYFSKIINERTEYSKGNYKFLKSLNIITKDDSNFIDFHVQLDYLKRNIHLNLLYYHQIERLVSLTSILEFNF